jgi:hypothetical protein
MRWSRLKSVVEALFAPAVAGRLAIHTTRYSNSSFGRAWLTWDGQELASFGDDNAYHRRKLDMFGEPCVIPDAERTPGQLVEDGEFSAFEFKDACFRFKDMDIEVAIHSPEPLIAALAAAHRKVGHQRVVVLATDHPHPLVRQIAQLRITAELRPIPIPISL